MKNILLASVAALALSFPAMAANSYQQSHMSQSRQSSTARVKPAKLSSNEIRQVQQNLKQQGFTVGKIDGKWGPKTARAVRNFQQKNSIQANGRLTQQTMAKLGVNNAGQSRNAKNATQTNKKSTVGAAPSGNSGMKQPSSSTSNMKPAQPSNSTTPSEPKQ